MEKMPENMPEKTEKGKGSKRVKFDKDEERLKRVKDSRRQNDQENQQIGSSSESEVSE